MSTLTVFGFTTLESASRIEAMQPVIRGRRLRTVIAGGCAAIVARHRAGWWPFSTKRAAARRLSVHHDVLETMMAVAPVLPAAFDTHLPSEGAVRAFLACCGGDLHDPLDHYGRLIQMDVRVCWSVIDAIARSRADGIMGLNTPALNGDSAATDALRQAIEGHRLALRERVRASLSTLAFDMVETRCGQDDIVAHFTLLMPRNHETALRAALERLDNETGGHLCVRCKGPLPPCGFAAVELDDLDYEDVAAARRQLDLADAVTPDDLKRAYHRAVREVSTQVGAGVVEHAADINRIREAYAILVRIAEGQLVRRPGEAPDLTRVVHLDGDHIANLFTMRLRRMDDDLAIAA